MSLLDTASLVVTPNGTKASKLYSVVPSSGAGDLDVTRATTATRVNSNGLIESVASNVPRLDYTNGSCPSILVEPQRTNLVLRSQEFDVSPWANAANLSFSSTTELDPSGLTNAKKATNTINNGAVQFFQLASTASNTYTHTIYVKKDTNRYFSICLTSGITASDRYVVFFDLQNGSVYQVYNTLIPLTNTSNKIEDAGNGWYRCSITATCDTLVYVVGQSTNNGTLAYNLNGDLTNATAGSVFVWGAQLEAGSYATSYIPTTSASVTRNADQVAKTGISSLIGQTEGVWYLDLYASGKDKDGANYANWFIAGDSPSNLQLYNIGTTLYWYVINNGSVVIAQTANQTIVEGERYKIAIAYKSGDYALYINGVQKRTSTGSGVPAVSQFNLSAEGVGASQAIVKNEYNTVALWKTRLPNTQLAQLTTI
jgi:hypothetical protein